jgi:uncharacterized membrane protein
MEVWKLHASAVHFPIALSMAAFVFAAIGCAWKDESFTRASWYTTVLLGLTGAVAILFGAIALIHMAPTGDVAKAAHDHMGMGIATGVVALVQFAWVLLLLFRKRALSRRAVAVYTVLTLATMILAFITGYLGGRLADL